MIIIVLYVVIEAPRGQLQAVLVKNEEYQSRLVGVGHIYDLYKVLYALLRFYVYRQQQRSTIST